MNLEKAKQILFENGYRLNESFDRTGKQVCIRVELNPDYCPEELIDYPILWLNPDGSIILIEVSYLLRPGSEYLDYIGYPPTENTTNGHNIIISYITSLHSKAPVKNFDIKSLNLNIFSNI